MKEIESKREVEQESNNHKQCTRHAVVLNTIHEHYMPTRTMQQNKQATHEHYIQTRKRKHIYTHICTPPNTHAWLHARTDTCTQHSCTGIRAYSHTHTHTHTQTHTVFTPGIEPASPAELAPRGLSHVYIVTPRGLSFVEIV